MNTPQLTKNQALVFDVLEKAEGPLSAYTILDKLRDHGFRAPLQVYRALEKLLEYGVVHRLESINSFVVCAHPDENCHGTVAFAICDSCGQVIEFHAYQMLEGYSYELEALVMVAEREEPEVVRRGEAAE